MHYVNFQWKFREISCSIFGSKTKQIASQREKLKCLILQKLIMTEKQLLLSLHEKLFSWTHHFFEWKNLQNFLNENWLFWSLSSSWNLWNLQSCTSKKRQKKKHGESVKLLTFYKFERISFQPFTRGQCCSYLICRLESWNQVKDPHLTFHSLQHKQNLRRDVLTVLQSLEGAFYINAVNSPSMKIWNNLLYKTVIGKFKFLILLRVTKNLSF